MEKWPHYINQLWHRSQMFSGLVNMGQKCLYLSSATAPSLQLLQFFLDLPHSVSHLLLSTLEKKRKRAESFPMFHLIITTQVCWANQLLISLSYFRPLALIKFGDKMLYQSLTLIIWPGSKFLTLIDSWLRHVFFPRDFRLVARGYVETSWSSRLNDFY